MSKALLCFVVALVITVSCQTLGITKQDSIQSAEKKVLKALEKESACRLPWNDDTDDDVSIA